MNYNIAILVPTTSNQRNYKSLEDSDLYSKWLKSFLTTYDSEHKYTIYLGIDDNDIFFNDIEIQNKLTKFISIMKNVNIKIHNFDKTYKGNVVAIWNQLFKISYNDNNDYFHQTGDDVIYLQTKWVNECIRVLTGNSDMGVVGHTDKGRKYFNPFDDLITQSFVSRLHMEIFNFYFAPEILNWGCDNFIGDIYQKHNMKFIISHEIINTGGEPRYEIDLAHNDKLIFCMNKYKNYIKNYINKKYTYYK
tara:strand:+ start:105 stop:848 length:744 start_codon:yes stop_codon:yes gene_type:complete